MSDDVIACSQLRKIYRSEAEDLEILASVEMRVPRGSSVSITGPSGCGKSTLLSILGGLDHPTSGEVVVGGLDLLRADEASLARFRSKVVGFVFQFHYLLKDFTALENVMLPSFILTGDKKAAIEKAVPLLEAVGLGKRMSHVPAKLSGGERQRVAIARALINEPEIVLADEPTGNLDRGAAGAVEELLYDMVSRTNTTLLIVTHDHEMSMRSSLRYTLRDGALYTT